MDIQLRDPIHIEHYNKAKSIITIVINRCKNNLNNINIDSILDGTLSPHEVLALIFGGSDDWIKSYTYMILELVPVAVVKAMLDLADEYSAYYGIEYVLSSDSYFHKLSKDDHKEYVLFSNYFKTHIMEKPCINFF